MSGARIETDSCSLCFASRRLRAHARELPSHEPPSPTGALPFGGKSRGNASTGPPPSALPSPFDLPLTLSGLKNDWRMDPSTLSSSGGDRARRSSAARASRGSEAAVPPAAASPRGCGRERAEKRETNEASELGARFFLLAHAHAHAHKQTLTARWASTPAAMASRTGREAMV